MKKIGLVFLLLQSILSYCAQNQNLITRVHCSKNSIRLILNSKLKKKNYVLNDFFVEYFDEEMDCTQLDYSIITLPAVMNLITLVWASGDTYYIDAMDEQLYNALPKLKEVFKRLYPNTAWDGQLRPRRLVDNRNSFLSPVKNEDHVAMLFSHGLDSICTSLRHADKKQLLLTAWGHSDCPLEYKDAWQYFKGLVDSFAQRFGHTPCYFSSNYHTFLNLKYLDKNISPEICSWRIGAIEGLGWIGLVAPILLSKGYTSLYIASSQAWSNPYPQASLPMIDETATFAGIRIVHDAFDMLREDKNEYIAQECKHLGIKALPLRVCPMITKYRGHSCSNCEKCLRTITGFLLLGESVKKFNFKISNSEAIKRVKNYLSKIKLVDRGSFFWKTLQQFGKKNMKILDAEHKQFAKWLLNFDMDKITLFRPIKKIDWSEFTDLYDIPSWVLKKEMVM